MPRDASGNYTLPAGNPVISGTTITSNWANDTMSDVGNEITDSLSRSGQGGMLAPLQFVDGSASQPGISFILEPTLGWFRTSTSVMALASLGNTYVEFDAPNNTMILPQPAPIINSVDDTQPLLFQAHGGDAVFGGQAKGITPVDAEDFTRKDYVDENFDKYLDGFISGGLHDSFIGDLDDIILNSEYTVGAVSNAPPDFGGGVAILNTKMHATADWGVQLLYGVENDLYTMWQRQRRAGSWNDWKKVIDGNLLEFIDSDAIFSGNVGIGGAVPPSELLEVGGAVDGRISIRSALNANTNLTFLETSGNPYGGSGTGAFRLQLDGAANRFEIISANEATFNTRFVIERDTGNVGIGTSTPSFSRGSGLDIFRNGIATLRLTGTNTFGEISMENSTGLRLETRSNLPIIFNINQVERMRLDTGLSIGGLNTNDAKLQVTGNSGSGTNPGILSVTTGTGSNSDMIMGLGLLDDSYGYIQVQRPGTANYALVFNPIGGNVGLGETNPTSKLHVTVPASNTFAATIMNSDATLPYCLYLNFNVATPNNSTNDFIRCEDASAFRMQVYSSGDIVNVNNSYGVLSDIKLKRNLAPARGYWDDFKMLKYQTFQLIADGGNGSRKLGLVAQDVEKIFPALVTHNPAAMGVKSSIIDGTICSIVLQEAMARIEALENTIH